MCSHANINTINYSSCRTEGQVIEECVTTQPSQLQEIEVEVSLAQGLLLRGLYQAQSGYGFLDFFEADHRGQKAIHNFLDCRIQLGVPTMVWR